MATVEEHYDRLLSDVYSWTYGGWDAALVARLEQIGGSVRERADVIVVEVEGEARVPEVLRAALDARATVLEVTPRRETLEDLFLRRAL